MERNSKVCSHCGKTFRRLTANTPIINRSFEKIFHLALFSGPQPRPNPYGGFYRKQLTCNFTYAHHRLGSENEYVAILILRAKDTERDTLRDVEAAADKMADLVAEGEKLGTVYSFENDELIAGFPK